MSKEPAQTRSFSDLYRATIQPLRRHLARLLGDHSEAQDIAHDAYLRLYPNSENSTAHNPEALLFTTAHRLALNRIKRRRNAPFTENPDAVATTPAPETDAAQQAMIRQELGMLNRAIADLPAGCRAVLLLRKVDLLSHQQIAERLGIAISTVEKQHARALRLLRTALQTEAPPAAPSGISNTDTIRP